MQNSHCDHIDFDNVQRPRKHFESGGALAKRGTFVYDQNQTIFMSFTSRTKCHEHFCKYGVSITSEMAFTESLLLQKGGHFLSSKRGLSFKKYFFRSLNGAL